MARLAHTIDAVNEAVGRAVSWLTLVMVLLQFSLVLLRYVFGLSDRAWEELLLYLHGSLFLLAAAFTLKHNGHVRVDLLYRTANPHMQARINLIGTLFFLLPVCALVFWAGWPFVLTSWQSLEGSIEASGLPFTYLYKSVILIFAALLTLQGIAQAIKAVMVLRGRTAVEENDGIVL